ncbi:acyltransferase family protein [Carnimonas bestiolae]|uniref:acyltransferase family protein n=1 Tax=Carnimonas bestiolae TaxID=3402172 RepID=UPI003EDBAF98
MATHAHTREEAAALSRAAGARNDAPEGHGISVGKPRFVSLEWMRFLLGLYIVVFHTLHHYKDSVPWAEYVSNIGFFSTSTFFILSGFLLAHVYLDPAPHHSFRLRESKLSFLIKRFANLYPIHIGAIIITMVVIFALQALVIFPEDAHTTSIRYVIIDSNNDTPIEHLRMWMNNTQLVWATITNLTLTHAWNPYYLTFNAPSWSISALFFFYLLFPFIAPALRSAKAPMKALAIINICYLIPVVLIVLFTQHGAPETGILHRNPIVRLPEFMAGIVLCGVYHRWAAAGGRPTTKLVLTLIALIVAELAMAEYLMSFGYHGVWYYLLHDGLLMPAELALLFLCAIVPYDPSPKWRKIAGYLGGASLPMFALHVPLYLIFSRVEGVLSGQLGLCVSGQWRACFDAAQQPSIYFYPLFLLLTVVFCVLFQQQFVVRVRRFLIAHLTPASVATNNKSAAKSS